MLQSAKKKRVILMFVVCLYKLTTIKSVLKRRKFPLKRDNLKDITDVYDWWKSCRNRLSVYVDLTDKHDYESIVSAILIHLTRFHSKW